MSSPAANIQTSLYSVLSSASDESYISPYLDSLESPFTETIGEHEGPSALAQMGLDQRFRVPSNELWPAFETQNHTMGSAAISIPHFEKANGPKTSTTSNRPPAIPSTTSDPHPIKSKTKQKSKPKPKPKPPPHARTKTPSPPSPSSDSDSTAALKAEYKHAHSIIERRYRDNLNSHILHLQRVLLATESNQSSKRQIASSSSRGAGGKVRKSDIMACAIEYVQRNEAQMRRLEETVRRYQRAMGEGTAD